MIQQRHESSWIIMNLIAPRFFEKEKHTLTVLLLRDRLDRNINLHRIQNQNSPKSPLLVLIVPLIAYWSMFYDSDLSPKTKHKSTNHLVCEHLNFSFSTEAHLKSFQSGKGRPTSALEDGVNRPKVFQKKQREIFISWLLRFILGGILLGPSSSLRFKEWL